MSQVKDGAQVPKVEFVTDDSSITLEALLRKHLSDRPDWPMLENLDEKIVNAFQNETDQLFLKEVEDLYQVASRQEEITASLTDELIKTRMRSNDVASCMIKALSHLEENETILRQLQQENQSMKVQHISYLKKLMSSSKKLFQEQLLEQKKKIAELEQEIAARRTEADSLRASADANEVCSASVEVFDSGLSDFKVDLSVSGQRMFDAESSFLAVQSAFESAEVVHGQFQSNVAVSNAQYEQQIEQLKAEAAAANSKLGEVARGLDVVAGLVSSDAQYFTSCQEQCNMDCEQLRAEVARLEVTLSLTNVGIRTSFDGLLHGVAETNLFKDAVISSKLICGFLRRRFGSGAEYFAVQVGLGYKHLASRGLALQGCTNDIVSFASFFRERGVTFSNHVVCSDEVVGIECTQMLGGALADILCALKMTKDAMDRSVAREKYLFFNFSGYASSGSGRR